MWIDTVKLQVARSMNSKSSLFYNDIFHLPKFSMQEKARLPRVVQRIGGKGRLYVDYLGYIRDMANLINAETFVDCFGGGGSMSMAALLMKKEDGITPLFSKVIYNEFEVGIYTLFRVVKDPQKCNLLVELILHTQYNRTNFDNAYKIMNSISDGQAPNDSVSLQDEQNILANASQYINDRTQNAFNAINTAGSAGNVLSDIDIAYFTYIKSLLSFNCMGKNYRDYESYEFCGNDYQKQFWRQAMRLPDITPLFERLEVRCGSYETLLDENLKRSFPERRKYIHFLDPPYIKNTRANSLYKNELDSPEEHWKMIDKLSHMDYWMICGYDGGLTGYAAKVYGDVLKLKGVQRIDLGAKARPSSGKKWDENDQHEILWLRK